MSKNSSFILLDRPAHEFLNIELFPMIDVRMGLMAVVSDKLTELMVAFRAGNVESIIALNWRGKRFDDMDRYIRDRLSP